jgi:hypothetical protein
MYRKGGKYREKVCVRNKYSYAPEGRKNIILRGKGRKILFRDPYIDSCLGTV